jgi:hypothetical protein
VELADLLAYTHEGKISVECDVALTKLLSQLETLFGVFAIKKCPRNFRTLYTPAYQQLLQVAFKADILEAAQQAFPHLWVNSVQYSFPQHLLTLGLELAD